MSKPVGPVHDLVIRNGQIVDGTGAEGFEGDIAIRDGIIQEIGQFMVTEKKRLMHQVKL